MNWQRTHTIQSSYQFGVDFNKPDFLPAKSVSSEDLCRYFTIEMAKALKSNGADDVRRLHVGVDEGIGQGAGCEYGL